MLLALFTLTAAHTAAAFIAIGALVVGMALSTKLPFVNDLSNLLFKLGFMDSNGNLKGPVGADAQTFRLYDQLLDSQVSAAGVANGADMTDDTLFSKVINPNTLSVNGDELVVEASGSFGATVNNKTVKVILGATTFLTSGVVTSNAKKWALYVRIKRVGAAAQVASAEFTVDGTASVVGTVTNGAEDLTSALTLKVTGASGTTGAANDVVGNDMSIVRRGLAA